MKHFVTSALLLVMVCVFSLTSHLACLSHLRGKPAWIFGHPHQNFPPAAYLSGIGSGSSPEIALSKAKSDFSARLIGALITNIGVSDRTTKFARAWFNPQVHQPDLSNLKPKLSATWQDPDGKIHITLVTMKRSIAETFLIDRIVKFDSICTQAATAAELALTRQNKPYQAIISYLRSLAAWTETEICRKLLPAISMVKPPKISCHDPMQSVAAVEKLISGCSIRSVHRPSVHEMAEKSSSRTFLISAAYIGNDLAAPVGQAPIRINRSSEEPPEENRTDELGLYLFSQENSDTIHTSSPTQTVRIQLNGRLVLSDAGIEPTDPVFQELALNLDGIQITITPQTFNNKKTRIALLVYESDSSGKLPKSLSDKILSVKLTERGFKVHQLPSIIYTFNPLPKIEQILQEAKHTSDILIAGAVEIHIDPQSKENFILARVNGEIGAWTTQTGTKLLIRKATVTAAGLDPVNAQQRALRIFIQKIYPDLLKAIQDNTTSDNASMGAF